MTSIVLIETNGTVKTLKAKEVSTETLYKKCGFRVADDFTRRQTWNLRLNKADQHRYIVSVWAKKTGKANFENKYDFPPPIDNDLYYGTCAIVRSDDNGDIIDLTKETWLKIYEKLFGGFEDLGKEDEYSEDELEGVDPSMLTSQGYLKDDFVVSDREPIESADSSRATSPLHTKALKNKNTVSKKKPQKKSQPQQKKSKQKVIEEENMEDDDDDDGEITSSSELEEETYIFSDED